MGLDYVLKEPSYYPLEGKRRCGVTQKKPFRRFKIVCLVFPIFLRIFFSYQNKSIKSFIVTGRLHALTFFCKIGSEAAGATSFLRIDLADCAADQFS